MKKAAKIKQKSFFEEIKMLNKKTKRETKDAKPKSEAEQNELTRVANELRKNDNLTLDDIKNAIKNNSKLKQTDAKIIDTILKCKMKEDKILLKDDTFAKQLSFYLVGRDIKTKYLTNDFLYLNMIASKFVIPNNESGVLLNQLLRGSVLQSVTIVSENFDVNKETVKGLIQDYDGNFSLICSQEIKGSDLIDDIILKKPNSGSFYLDSVSYNYYGNEDACIIQAPGMNEDEVKNRIENMKFVHNENSIFSSGEKKVTADGRMKFISKKLYPESFCPSFWAAPNPIRCDFLFEFSIDYNVLFDYLEFRKGDENIIPQNICYWDNIKYFFDFLGVFYLTARELPENQRMNIGNQINAFKSIRDFCTAWKSQALNVQRVFQDFLNAFLNNSSFSRFTFLYEKVSTVHKSITELMNKSEYSNFCKVLSKYTTLCYINNQLNKMKEVVGVLSGVRSCLKKYIEGSNADTLWQEITSVANKILLYLPNNTQERDALFPFICAEGGFNDGISGNKDNSSLLSVKRNIRRVLNDKERNKKIVTAISSTTSQLTKDLKNYFQTHIRDNSPDLSDKVENALVDALFEYFISSEKVGTEREKLMGHVSLGTKLNRPTEILIDRMAKAFIDRTRSIKTPINDDKVRDFIDLNEGRIEMLMGNSTFKPKKKEKKEKTKDEEKEEEKEEEEKSENDEK